MIKVHDNETQLSKNLALEILTKLKNKKNLYWVVQVDAH